MKKILENLADKHEIKIQNLEVLPDHIHLLISFPPKYSASFVVQTLKGGSARQWFTLHPETKGQLWGGHLWSSSYFMSTLGRMSKDTVEKYIENQLTEYNAGRRPRR